MTYKMHKESSLKRTSLTKGAVFQSAGKILLESIAFFTAPIFTRILSTDDYGKISVYTTWCSLFSLFVGLQVGGSIANAKIEYTEEKLPEYMSSVMTIAILFFIILLIIIAVFCRSLAHFINIRVDLVFLLVVQSFASFCINFYNMKLIQFKQAHKSMYLMTVTSILSTVLSLIFVFTLQGEMYISKIYGTGIPIVAIGFFLCIYILAKGKVFFNINYWKFCLVLTIPLIFHGAGQLILGQSDRIMLQKMIGESETGIYCISATVTAVMTTIYGSFNTVWIPYYYEYKKKHDVQTILMQSRNYMFNIAGTYAVFLLIVPEIFRILVPEVYWEYGLKIIPILTLSSFFNYLYLFPVNYEFFSKNTKMIATGTFVSALINVVLNFLLIKRLSSIGAAIATCISSLLLFLFHLVSARHIIKQFEYPLSFFLLGIIPVGIALGIYMLLAGLWIVRWVFATAIGTILLVRFLKKRSLF